jgi:hypothetical protein
MRRALALLFLPLAACADNWAKPGATANDFRVAEAGCEVAAMREIPPLPETVLLDPGLPAWRWGWAAPPSFRTVDRNAPLRRRVVQACLLQAGWTPLDRQGNPRDL